jgi:histidinol dehydrogenase
MEDLNRETEKDVRDVTSTLDKDVRQTMRETEERIEDDMAKLESDLNQRIQEALDNPLAN